MKKHVHKYEKVVLGKNGTEFFRCRLPDCPHVILAPFALGRKSVCWGCGNPFLLDVDKMRRKKPTCDNCIALSPRGRRKRVDAESRKTKSAEILNPLDKLDIDKLLENL